MKEKKAGSSQKMLGVLFVILIVFISILASILIVDARHIKFIFNGPEHLTAEAGRPFKDPGVRAITSGALFRDGEEELKVRVEGEVDTSKLGSYKLRYKTNYLFSTVTAERTIEVVDTLPPEIELNHTEGYSPTWMTGYVEEGFTAVDLLDGDLTDKVETVAGDGVLLYTVTDSSGNKAVAERELSGMALPTINLVEGDNITVEADMMFSDPGFIATDGCGNDITASVMVSGDVYSHIPGEYEKVYYLENAAGERLEATRHISIVPATRHDYVLPSQKTIYLTFDDGPGPYTAELLDVLAEYGVKATFFVTNAFPKYQYLIGRAYSEGHAIGVHTYGHDYNYIYSSEEAYFADFNAMQQVIHDQTGSYTKLFRFPGGSSNTVSNFNPGIMTRLTETMEDMGYVYFDWNVTSGDAGETKKTSVVIDNVTDGCVGKTAAVVLQHDIKDFSVDAVRSIIRWGLNNGYSFSALNESSYTAHHGVNN